MGILFPAYMGNEPYMFVFHADGNSKIVYPEMEWKAFKSA